MFSRLALPSGRGLAASLAVGKRGIATSSPIVTKLQEQMMEEVKVQTPLFLELRKKHGETPIGNVTVNSAVLGMKGIPGLFSETSLLDVEQGIRYRGYTLRECQEMLPKPTGGTAALPEAAWWLLLTRQIPTHEEMTQLQEELYSRMEVPPETCALVDGLPKDMHPMTQMCCALLHMQRHSKFAKAYREGMKKGDYWLYILEDSLDIVAKLPVLCARIFRHTYFEGQHIAPDPSLDWAGNFAHMIGVNDSDEFKDVLRLYLMLHADHEAGNVSAHTSHLVSSALSDPYLSLSAGFNGLAGPLHGLANQECLRWLKEAKKAFGDTEPTVENMSQYAKDTLAAGKVIPGFGHGALRIIDPRYTIQKEFAEKFFPDDELYKLADICFRAIPPVLQATGKVKNPWPNVDAMSGVCISRYGMTQEDYYTVIFAISRSLGCTANMILSRMYGLPIERPKSVNMDWLMKKTGMA